jgi:peptidoglycan/LPS O-acetylase OafA/YrhL
VNRETSLYLDAVRFVAALTVFLGHVSGARFMGGFLWHFGSYTGEAVIVFFVLSGFVIGYATDRRENSVSSYAVARAARIYSVALPALIVTFALDSIGRSVRPDLYSPSWGYVATDQVWQFISGSLFINQIWFLKVPQGSDLSYWSLGYEVWYYAIFGLMAFMPTRRKLPATLAALIFVGPRVAVLFPLWLLGLFSYRLCARHPLNYGAGALLYLGSLVAWIGYEIGPRRAGWLLGAPPSFLERPDLAQDYVVGMLFAAHVIGFRALSPLFGRLLNRLARPIRWSAGATFSVYLFHLPVAQFLTTQMPWPPAFWATRVIMICGTLAIVLALAEVTERRKELWRHGFAALLQRRVVSL